MLEIKISTKLKNPNRRCIYKKKVGYLDGTAIIFSLNR